LYESAGSNGSGVTVNIAAEDGDDDLETSRAFDDDDYDDDYDSDDVPLAAEEEIVTSPCVEVKAIVDEPESKRAKFD
jgi:hypothetical protein